MDPVLPLGVGKGVTTIVLQSSYVFLACLLLAWLEVQIEGPHGWAKDLPTWREHPPWATDRNVFFRVVGALFAWGSGGNRLTGYHAAMMSFLVVMSGMPLVLTAPSWPLFFECAGYLAMMTVVWDFLWFVINPAFGIRRFRPEHIAWHPRWWGPMPSAYPGGLALAACLLSLAHGPVLQSWTYGATAVAVEALLTLAVIGIAEAVRR